MNTRLIVNLSLLGIIPGTCIYFNWLTDYQFGIFILFGLLTSWIIVKRVSFKKFLHAFMIGFLFLMLAQLIPLSLQDFAPPATNMQNPETLINTTTDELKIQMLSASVLMSVAGGGILILLVIGMEKFVKPGK